MIAALRTPEERFTTLPGFPFPPSYVDDLPGYEGLRGAYVDVGPPDAEQQFLCLHGEPTWSYLYRKMIPPFLGAGGRVIALDLLGFGRSDKPVDDAVYSFAFHRGYLLRLIERLDLRNVTLVCQDWGGLLGLTLPVDDGFAARLARLIVMNTTIGVGAKPTAGFLEWQAFNRAQPDLRVGALIRSVTPVLTPAEAAAYDAPFPDARFKAGVRAFPELVMTRPDMPGVAEGRRAIEFWSTRWTGPSFMAIGAADPIVGLPVMQRLRALIRGCPEPLVLEEAGHFVQEWGEPVARAAMQHFAAAEGT